MRRLNCSEEQEVLSVAKRDPAFRGLTEDQILRHIIDVKDHGDCLTVRLQRGSDVLNASIKATDLLVS